MPRRNAIPRNVSGEQVRLAIVAAHPNGLSVAELMRVTGLTRSQVAAGIVWIKEKAAAEHLTPLTRSRREGYRFSDGLSDWAVYERSQLLRGLTLLVPSAPVQGHLRSASTANPAGQLGTHGGRHGHGMITGLEFITSQPPTPTTAGPARS